MSVISPATKKKKNNSHFKWNIWSVSIWQSSVILMFCVICFLNIWMCQACADSLLFVLLSHSSLYIECSNIYILSCNLMVVKIIMNIIMMIRMAEFFFPSSLIRKETKDTHCLNYRNVALSWLGEIIQW